MLLTVSYKEVRREADMSAGTKHAPIKLIGIIPLSSMGAVH